MNAISVFAYAVQAILLLLSSDVYAACECGYTVNSTESPSYALYSDLLETDFLHLSPDALDWSQRNETGWSWQVYQISPAVARGPYGKDMQARNVVINPMKSHYDWAGPTELGGDGGLQIWVRAEDQVRNKRVPAGEIVSLQSDMMYGSYRIGVKWTATPGTCGSFFWYRNNSMEIDMEYLSWQQSPNATSKAVYHPINLVNQSPESVAAGFNAAGTDDFDVYPLGFSPSDSFHEYRFDWTPGRISFYVDGKWLKDMTDSTPDGPGRLFVNHWSNGDPSWSGGPPTQDALMTVSYIKAYFNSTDAARRRAYANSCTNKYTTADALNHACQVPDQTVPPDQGGSKGNQTAKTFFFTQPADRGDNGTSSTRHKGAGSKSFDIVVGFSNSNIHILIAASVLLLLTCGGLDLWW